MDLSYTITFDEETVTETRTDDVIEIVLEEPAFSITIDQGLSVDVVLNPVDAVTVEIEETSFSFTPSVTYEATGGGNIRFDTTENWDAQGQLISEQDVVYVYTDHETSPMGDPVPGFKVGDGLAFLIDLPFSDVLAMQHRADETIHVTAEEKAFWNEKVRVYIDATNLERLVFDKN